MTIQPWSEVGDGASLMDRIDGRVPFEVRRKAYEAVLESLKPKVVSFTIEYRFGRNLEAANVRPWARQAASIAERVAGAPKGSVGSIKKTRGNVIPARLATIHAIHKRFPSISLSALGRIIGRHHSTICHALAQDPAKRGFQHIIETIMQEIGHG